MSKRNFFAITAVLGFELRPEEAGSSVKPRLSRYSWLISLSRPFWKINWSISGGHLNGFGTRIVSNYSHQSHHRHHHGCHGSTTTAIAPSMLMTNPCLGGSCETITVLFCDPLHPLLPNRPTLQIPAAPQIAAMFARPSRLDICPPPLRPPRPLSGPLG